MNKRKKSFSSIDPDVIATITVEANMHSTEV